MLNFKLYIYIYIYEADVDYNDGEVTQGMITHALNSIHVFVRAFM